MCQPHSLPWPGKQAFLSDTWRVATGLQQIAGKVLSSERFVLPAHSPSLLPHPPGYANQELSPTQSPSSASSGAGPPGRLTCLPLAVIHGLRKKIITLKSQQEVFPVWQPPPVLPPAAAILCQAPG